MRVLVACECSGRVRDAFAALGHDAWSCDVQPSDTIGNHLQCDVLSVLNDGWDLMVAHPPCTYLCNMGVWWNHKRPERWAMTDEAVEFARRLFEANIKHKAIENPVGILSRKIGKPHQIVNPWQFGDESTKPTCLWLAKLPPLVPTKIVDKGRFYVKSNGARMSAWSHKCSGTNKEKRAKIAATTFPGIANAMARQWSDAIEFGWKHQLELEW